MSHPKGGRMPFILIVDDDVTDRWIMREMLELEGYEVSEASSGSEALGSIEERLPDLMLLDIMMPHMDGWRVLDELRRRDLRDAVRVVLVSGRSDAETVGRGRREGAGYVGKPFDVETLMGAVEAALRFSPEELLLRRGRFGQLARVLQKIDHLNT